MSKRNTPITQLPQIGSQVINLWVLYSMVAGLGGMSQVNKDAAWPQVAKSLGLSDTDANVPWALKNCYAKLLFPFEQAYLSQAKPLLPMEKPRLEPQIRSVESYGGVDLRLFQQPVLKSLQPRLGDLGHIDIHALTMSLKSSLRMEMINALNVLSMLTVERNGSLLLEQCGDLLEALMDLLVDFLEKLSQSPALGNSDDMSYSRFYEASHVESCQVQDTTVIAKDDLYLFENQRFIAGQPQIVNTLTEYFGVGGCKGINMCLLENRKNILVIFSNIGSMMHLVSLDATRLIIKSLIDFLENAGDTYSSLAVETLAKITVPYGNRTAIFEVFFTDREIFSILLKHIPFDNLRLLTQEKELVVAEMAILALQNICSIADTQSRRRISEIPGLVLSLMRLTIKMSERTLPTFDLFRPLCGKILETLKVLSVGNEDIFGHHLDRFVNLLTSSCLDAFVTSELIRLSNAHVRNI
ncbi:hypothetical protein K493DRAFT_404026 [Basidiobolus meristosporus CBS 931.73]|uniref:ARID domain-containing protein n=1 Tax=Basidiobolus meristosporus CBS 931.73 TaxID=1314790 RepID=A0A1Y1Z9L2_9FUNG|nr:hypothetical protein K493DRAFT_404026 [Basidiobolus meristosporus CBS 931.73]|eukprot:ORY06475.1 hypothetical protein K493DRAFT_404026 [Basidiobolus meristosporus CBS 931.73]